MGSFGHGRAPVLQEWPSLLSTSHSPGRSLCGCVVSPAATALGLFPPGRATTGEVGDLKRDASGRVTAVSLRVSKALEALT